MKIEPTRTFSGEEVKAIRLSANLTQLTFAAVLGVSKKTVEAWECGRYTPGGPACRLLSMIEKEPEFLGKYDFVKNE